MVAVLKDCHAGSSSDKSIADIADIETITLKQRILKNLPEIKEQVIYRGS